MLLNVRFLVTLFRDIVFGGIEIDIKHYQKSYKYHCSKFVSNAAI